MMCRGCLTGVGVHVSPRLAQTYERSIAMTNGKTTLFLTIAPDEERSRLQYKAPFALIVNEIARRERAGWSLVPPAVRPDPDHACRDCHGTRLPQLSVRVLDAAVNRPTQIRR